MSTMAICLLIFLAMIILFFIKKIPMAYTCMGVIVALFVTGCVDKETVFLGFGNNNVVTMASMFVRLGWVFGMFLSNSVRRLIIIELVNSVPNKDNFLMLFKEVATASMSSVSMLPDEFFNVGSSASKALKSS